MYKLNLYIYAMFNINRYAMATNVYCLKISLKNDYYELSARASFIFQITHQSRIPILFSGLICVCVPRTTIQPCPFKQLKVGSVCTCPFIPLTLIRPGPFQQLKVTILGSIGTCPYVPRTVIRPALFQQLQVTI